ncbi:SET domain-containing protein [Corticibacter populi]|uniref:SET domain-containing protein n=1 Tax=Corticibacter populi TaxID=1550736 RepID=A0A3M6QP01_9BURK|nr:SET domain-containing protein-lysine N-methyltransferase [Corticibacter populi]RMX04776.1 SET domain-containing protein [Corticibacter populi]RZS33812.1 hypothetical protein EV687_2139 [Corticibacter populi]
MPPKSPAGKPRPDAAARPGRRIQVRRSGVHGKGVYACRPIEPGEWIIEYKGERIDWQEAERRHALNEDDPYHTFLFQLDDGWVIDGGAQGNAARWINHSCAPNCEACEDERGRIFICALVPIEAGEELFFDYALEIEGRLTTALKRAYACRCGAPECRGTMLMTRKGRARKPAAPPAKAAGARP